MIRFLIKGVLRDKSRSRLPILVVTIGVTLTVWLHAYITGFMGDTIEMNARFSAGHLKVATRAYFDEIDQLPNDLAMLDTGELLQDLAENFPDFSWSERILFGGLIDVPDVFGETRAQGPAMGMGVTLLDNAAETERLRLTSAIVRGGLPIRSGEVLLSEQFSQKLKVSPGDKLTLIGSTMEGSMAFYNFTLAGTLRFGADALDRGTIIADIGDVRHALQMENATGEILGFLPGNLYINDQARRAAASFNARHTESEDEFTPKMLALSQQGTMGFYVEMAEVWSFYISMVFVMAMSLVLWNAGLLGGLRRYGEIGIRLAMGEEKRHVYLSMIYESVFIGIIGSGLGTAFGLFFAWLLQTYGINISGMMQGGAVMMPDVIRARITPPDYYLGFVPGLLSMVIGTMLSGIGIFKRQTARLFKELEN